jgi:hypothetical protein
MSRLSAEEMKEIMEYIEKGTVTELTDKERITKLEEQLRALQVIVLTYKQKIDSMQKQLERVDRKLENHTAWEDWRDSHES